MAIASTQIIDGQMPDALARYTIGFFKSKKETDNTERLMQCGSGVLLAVDDLKGAITAAHVISELRNAPHVALFTIVNARERARRIVFSPDEAQYVTFGPSSKCTGPDLGYIRFPIEVENSLKAENTFYNYNIRTERANESEPPLTHNFLCGIIAEKIELKCESENSAVITVTMSLAAGGASNFRRAADGFDYFDFSITHNEEVARPGSYGGLSGSAVWKTADSDSANDRFVHGVAFYQSEPDSNGDRIITCHGPRSIYEKLIPKIRQKLLHAKF